MDFSPFRVNIPEVRELNIVTMSRALVMYLSLTAHHLCEQIKHLLFV